MTHHHNTQMPQCQFRIAESVWTVETSSSPFPAAPDALVALTSYSCVHLKMYLSGRPQSSPICAHALIPL